MKKGLNKIFYIEENNNIKNKDYLKSFNIKKVKTHNQEEKDIFSKIGNEWAKYQTQNNKRHLANRRKSVSSVR